MKTIRGTLQGAANTINAQANGNDVDNDHTNNRDQPSIKTHANVNEVETDNNNIENNRG